MFLHNKIVFGSTALNVDNYITKQGKDLYVERFNIFECLNKKEAIQTFNAAMNRIYNKEDALQYLNMYG